MGYLCPALRGMDEYLSVLVPCCFPRELQFKIIRMPLGNILGWPAWALTVSSSDTVLEAHIQNAELGTGEGETELVNEW